MFQQKFFQCKKKGTIESYINYREQVQGFKFDQQNDITTLDFRKSITREVEKRWEEMYDVQCIKEYDVTGEEGWNCESVVFYILYGQPESPQGSENKFWKRLGVLDKDGNPFSSQFESL